MSGASASGASASRPGAGSNTSPTGCRALPVVGRPHIEAGRITRVRVTVDLHKLLQVGDDPRRESAHHSPPLE